MTSHLPIAALLAVTALPAVGSAQPATAPTPLAEADPSERSPGDLLIGAAAGVGRMFVICDGCDDGGENGLSLDVGVGVLLTRNVALLYDGSVVAHFDSEDGAVVATNAVAAQTWITSGLWARGGLGVGYRDTVDSEVAFALSAAIGYDFVRSGPAAFDARLRATSGFYDGANLTTVGLLAGVGWY